MRSVRNRTILYRNIAAILGIGILLAIIITPAQAYQLQTMVINGHGQVEFDMPSGNIGCVYTPAGGTAVYATQDGLAEIQCDRVEPSYVRGILGGQGKGRIINSVGDQACCGGAQTFHYDHYVQLGPFQCLSTRQGLTCARSDGHGIFMSRAKLEAR